MKRNEMKNEEWCKKKVWHAHNTSVVYKKTSQTLPQKDKVKYKNFMSLKKSWKWSNILKICF